MIEEMGNNPHIGRNGLTVKSIFFLGKSPAYPINKVPLIHEFGELLKEIGIELVIGKGSHHKDDNGSSLGRANVDSLIIAFLTSNVLISYLIDRFTDIHQYTEDTVLRTIREQYFKYLNNPPIHIVIFTGDEDFIPLGMQLKSYSEDSIKVYYCSHPCITNGSIKSRPNYIDLQEVLRESFVPPWIKGTVITVIDGNNFLNSLVQGEVQGLLNGKRVTIKDREDWNLAFSIIKEIYQRLDLIPKGFDRLKKGDLIPKGFDRLKKGDLL